MNINYPNNFDHLNGRGGSGILIHGGCGSIGCFAIQNENVEEVYGAVRAALRNSQAFVPVLTLPFRFSALAPEKEDTLHMSEFWSDLRRADLLFERDRLPPTAWICDGRYYFADRRGDRRRHAVHLPGCKPLDNPAAMRDAKNRPEPQKPVVEASTQPPQQAGGTQEAVETVAQAGSPERAVETAAQTGSPRRAFKTVAHANFPARMQSRMKHAALKSTPSCPKKYPRCRYFVGPEPKRTQSAARRSNILRVKHHTARGGGKLRRL
jgi:hypothetical protein